MQTDPIGSKDDLDLYPYVKEDPVNATDPTGDISDAVDVPATMQEAFSNTEAATPLMENVPGVSAMLEATKGNFGQAAIQGVLDLASGGKGEIASKALGKVAEKVITKVEKTLSGKRVGDFTRAQKNAAKAENAAKNGGKMSCADCGKEVKNVKSEKGVSTPDNQAQVHHDPPLSEGGSRDSKAEVLCPGCHQDRHDAE